MTRAVCLIVWTTTSVAGSALVAAPPVIEREPVVAERPVRSGSISRCLTCRLLPVQSTDRPIRPIAEGRRMSGEVPEPLPLPDEATVLPPPQGSGALEELIEQFLPDTSPDEQRIWAEELRHLPMEVVRDLLEARSSLGEPRPLPRTPAAALISPPASEAPLPNPAPLEGRPSASREAGSTLTVLKQAEAVFLHNIANAETPGYKRLHPLTLEAAGHAGLKGLTISRSESQGDIVPTGRPLDLAIDGFGLFQVRQGDRGALTRRGNFRLTAEGALALESNGENWLLHPSVKMPPEATCLAIGESGTVVCELPGGAEICVGQIELARVADISRLESIGSGLFTVAEGVGTAVVGLPGDDGLGVIRQASVERSNVDLTTELAALARVRSQLAAFESGSTPSLLATPSETEAVPLGGISRE